MGIDERKSVLGVCQKQRHRPASLSGQTGSAPLLFICCKVLYLNLLQVKLQLSS